MARYKSKVKYKGANYGIIKVKYKGAYYPVLLDFKDYLNIKALQKQFVTDTYGRVYCTHKYKQIEKKIYIHRIIKALHDPKYSQTGRIVIYHLNGVNLDNRLANLSHTEIKNPRRRIIIMNDPHVTPQMIPPYVSYMKPNKTHGARFSVVFNNIKWKCTSSKSLSLKFKLEQTKKFLRMLMLDPTIKQTYFKTAITDNQQSDQHLLKTYYAVIRVAGYKHIKHVKSKPTNNMTILRYSATGLTNDEKKLLDDFVIDISKYQANLVDLSDPTDKAVVMPTIPLSINNSL